jgi:predicted dehydrogenase
MRFALLGNHPDGVELACALADSGRHHIVACTAAVDEALLRRWGTPARIADVEEVLADPGVEAVIVAGSPAVRAAQLRRALQSERPVLCVQPPDPSPEVAYEAAMIRDDAGVLLLPILPEGLHPGIRRLADFIERPDSLTPDKNSPVGPLRLIEFERISPAELLEGLDTVGQKPSFPGWDILRTLGGEIQEVSAFAEEDEPRPGEPVLLSGRFERGGLFQMTLVPVQPAPRWRLAVIGSRGRAELLFPLGWQGPAFLSWRDEAGELHEEAWERWDPWPALVGVFEEALAGGRSAGRSQGGAPVPEPLRHAVTPADTLREAVLEALPQWDEPEEKSRPGREGPATPLSWQDTVRALELDDAARRSIERRRASMLEYPEASEEVGFKGTMTLVGCGMLWGILLLLILSRWVPQVGWLIVPLLVVFLALQFLRYLIPGPGGKR